MEQEQTTPYPKQICCNTWFSLFVIVHSLVSPYHGLSAKVYALLEYYYYSSSYYYNSTFSKFV